MDIGRSFRPGPRFGPQGIRRASAHYGPYNYEMGIDIREQLRVADVGEHREELRIEKSFDQVARGQPRGRERGFPGDPGRARYSGRARDAGQRRAPRRVRPSLTRSFPALLPCVSQCAGMVA
ncbi:MAG: arginase family protein [Actinobacteria bacterium]|nr:arginase family protein [Actinomycetota bacterium]